MLRQFSSLPPEIHSLIFSCLDQCDLQRCIRVCRSWRDACSPFFWADIDINPCMDLNHLMDDILRTALLRNVSYVHQLSVCLTHPELLDILVPNENGSYVSLCANIRSLRIFCIRHQHGLLEPPGPMELEVQVVKALRALVRHNPRLVELSIYPCITEKLLLWLTDIPGLWTLELAMRPSIYVTKRFLRAIPDTVQHVHMELNDSGPLDFVGLSRDREQSHS